MPDESLPATDQAFPAGASSDCPHEGPALESLVALTSRVLLREPPSDASSPVMKPVPAGSEGRYQVLGEIARGAVGVVFKGHDVDLGRAVAIKVLRSEHADNTGVVQRFVEEAQVGGQLQHPGIVPVYEMGIRDDGKTPWFAMKLVKGRTLSALLAGRKSPADERRRFLSIFEQICQTVAYAHSRGVVHRDLKPANVMIGAFGEVQVVDWGFAKVLARGDDEGESVVPAPERSVIATVRTESTDSASVVGSVFGTPAYMPPEQARGSVGDVDERSDVFSLGAVLCEILTGRPAYSGDPARLLMMAAQADLGDALARLAACRADADIVGVAASCLVAAREARPRNAADVAARVTAYLVSEEERTRTAQLAAVESRAAAARARIEAEAAEERASHARRQRRLTAAVAAAVLLAFGVTGGAWVWIEHDGAEHAASVSRDIDAAVAQSVFLRGRAVGRADARAAHDALDLAEKANVLASRRDVGADVRTRTAASLTATQADSVRAGKVATLVRRAKRTHYTDASIEALRKAAIVYPDCAQLHCEIAVGLGMVRVVDPDTWRESFAEIESEYGKAISLDPDSTQARTGLIGMLSDRNAEPAEAAVHCEALLRLEPSEPAWVAMAFDNAVKRGDLDEAARLARAAAGLDPGDDSLAPRLQAVRDAVAAAEAIVGGAPVPDAWSTKPWDLIDSCMFARRYATIARLWTAPAFGLGAPSESPYMGLCALRFAALRAGLGEGTDSHGVSDDESARFRRLSLDAYGGFLRGVTGGPAQGDDGRPWSQEAWNLEGAGGSWPDSPGGFPRAELMAKLPPVERAAWHDAFIDYDRFHRQTTMADQIIWMWVLSTRVEASMYESALDSSERAVRLHPEDVNLLNCLGCAQYRMAQFEKAVETLTRVDAALAAPPNNPRASTASFLAMAHAKLGRRTEARAALERCRVIAAQPVMAGRTDVRARVEEAESVLGSDEDGAPK